MKSLPSLTTRRKPISKNSYRHNSTFLKKIVIGRCMCEQNDYKNCLVGYTKLVMPAQGYFIIS